MSEHTSAEARQADGHDPWQLNWRDVTTEAAPRLQSLCALANGTLGVRAGAEEVLTDSPRVFLAGVWERTPIRYHERFPGFARHTETRLPVADATAIRVELGSAVLGEDGCRCLSDSHTLDLRAGCYRRSALWQTEAGARIEIHAERLVPLDGRAALALRYRIRSLDYSGSLAVESGIRPAVAAALQGDDPRIGAVLEGGLQWLGGAARPELAWYAQRTTHSGIAVLCVQRQHWSETGLCEAADHGDAGVAQRVGTQLSPGQEVVLEKYIAYACSPADTTPDQPALRARAEQDSTALAAAGFDRLCEQQRAWLESFWATLDLHIPGQIEIERALRFGLFHVQQAVARDGSGSAAAKGLSGEGYEGHFFWDAEVFMLPALVLVAPQLARGMLVYRYRTLDRARTHARELDHAEGALYAWRTISGAECSAYFPGGSAQYHINADIAWAIRLYVDASGDEEFMRDAGAEMLLETARIWMQIGHFSARRGGAFCIHEVTGPDEYSALVDNNHYTNRMAQQHLRDAAAVAEWMAARYPQAWVTLRQRIGLREQEPRQWRRAADAMHLPVDAALGIYPQDDGFLNRPRLPDELRGHGDGPLLLRLHPLTIYRHQVCKQADTVLALVLAGAEVDAELKRRTLEYYEQVTVHDSTLSASSFAVLAAMVGQTAKAERYLMDSLRVDLDDLHGNTAHGVHLAAMAGSWLALSRGFAGLRVEHDAIAFAPRCSEHWRGYRFGVQWRGAHLLVTVDRDGVLYQLHAEARAPLRLRHCGELLQIEPGASARRPLAAAPAFAAAASVAARPVAMGCMAVVFDLDGVLADTASLHLAAWRELADELGVPFDAALAERLKGVDRRGSLELVLGARAHEFSEEQKQALAERKNQRYIQRIEQLGSEALLPGAHATLVAARAAGLKLALASASRNAPQLLHRLGIAEYFDFIADPVRAGAAKPSPAIFLAAAAGLGLAPQTCIGIEDSAAGIAAIRAAGMRSVGIGSAAVLGAADVVCESLTDFDLESVLARTWPASGRTHAAQQQPRHTGNPRVEDL